MLSSTLKKLSISLIIPLGFVMPANAQVATPNAEIETLTPKKRIVRVVEAVPLWVQADRLRVRDNPYAGDVVGMLEMGQKVKVRKAVDNWIRISADGKPEKWVNRDFLSDAQVTWSNYGYTQRGSRSLADAPYDISLKRIKIKGVKDVKIYAADIKAEANGQKSVITRHEFRSGPYYEKRLVQCQDEKASHVKVLGEGYTVMMMDADPRNDDNTSRLGPDSTIDRADLSAVNKAIAAFTCKSKKL